MEEKHLQQHIKGTHEDYRPFVCSHCGKSFGTSTRLQRHEAIHARRDNQLRCSEFPPCDRLFKQQSALERHIRSDHLGLKPYVCKEPDCDASYDSAGALRNHMNREHAENKFWCEECPRPPGTAPTVGFTSKSLLQAHMRNEHMNCIFCAFRCNSKYDLNRHIEVHHSGMTADDRKNFECTWEGCDKRFTKRSNLNVHVRVAHEGLRFTCGRVDLTKSDGLEQWPIQAGCGRDFASKANLEDHVRHVHLGLERQQRPCRRAEAIMTAPTDFLDELSGATDAERRSLECTYPGCTQRFIRYHDLQLHLPSHDVPEINVMPEVQTIETVQDEVAVIQNVAMDFHQPIPTDAVDMLNVPAIPMDPVVHNAPDVPIDPALDLFDWPINDFTINQMQNELANEHFHQQFTNEEFTHHFNPIANHNEQLPRQEQQVDA